MFLFCLLPVGHILSDISPQKFLHVEIWLRLRLRNVDESTITNHPDATAATATVKHAFTPFIACQVLLIHLDYGSAIIKVYDLRFFRGQNTWTYELEAKALNQTTPDALTIESDGIYGTISTWNEPSLQEISRCYGFSTLLPNRAFFPHVLLQYIPDALNFYNIVVEPDKSLITSLIKTGFGPLGYRAR